MYNQPMYYNPGMQSAQQRLQMMENQWMLSHTQYCKHSGQ